MRRVRPAVGLTTVVAALSVAALSSCGTTTIDTSVTTAPAATTTTLPPVDPAAGLDELLPLLATTLRPLDEQVIDGDDEATLARAEAVWAAAEPQLRAARPELLVGFEQVMTLARTAVERRRPADASKAYKLLVPLVDDALAG